jgi:outer membrane immunogenic protein
LEFSGRQFQRMAVRRTKIALAGLATPDYTEKYCETQGVAMRKSLLASVSAVALTCSATMPVHAAPPPPPTWTGFYVGLNAGYAWGKSDPSLILSPSSPPFGLFPNTEPAPALSPRGFIGGGQIGYNWQTGQWVFGAEVDFSGINAKTDATVSPFFIGKGSDSVTWASRYDWLFTARLRGGYLVAPNWLLYVTGGLAVTQVRDSVTCTALGNGCGNFAGPVTLTWSSTSTLTGGTIGGGIETMFAPNWSARLEYLHAKFKDTTPESTTPVGAIPALPPLFSFNHSLNVVRFAINYKFNP